MQKGAYDVKMRDVARAAKVSSTTVSYVLNGRGNISEATRRRVYEAADQLGYQMNSAGRALALQRPQAVGMVIPRAPFALVPWANVLAGVTDGLRAAGYDLTLLASADLTLGALDDTLETYRNAVRSRRIAGIISMEKDIATTLHADKVVGSIPIVTPAESHDAGVVSIDGFDGGRMAAEHLLEYGHRRLAFIGVDSDLSHRVRDGFLAELQNQKYSLHWITEESEPSTTGGYMALHRLYTNGHRPTAVFAASPLVAEGVLRAAAELHRTVPQQLSIISFGQPAHQSSSAPRITNITTDGYKLGQLLAKSSIARIEETAFNPDKIVPYLTMGHTTGRIGHYEEPWRDPNSFVLKCGGAFAVFSENGEIGPSDVTTGLYAADTRLVHLYRVKIDGDAVNPIQVQSSNDGFVADYIIQTQAYTRRLHRVLQLTSTAWEDTWTWMHYGSTDAAWQLDLEIGCGFHDLFSLRGVASFAHPSPTVTCHRSSVHFCYEGLDGIVRQVRVSAFPEPYLVESSRVTWQFVESVSTGSIRISLKWDNPALLPSMSRFQHHDASLWPTVAINDAAWQKVLDQSRNDVQMMLTDFGEGPVVMAGLPWVATLFGRDAVVVALQLLEWAPTIAERTLATLASFQGVQDNEESGEESGRILHELRLGEWANEGWVPLGRHYGFADPTPLFLILFSELSRRLGDSPWTTAYLPSALKALDWVERRLRQDHTKLLRGLGEGAPTLDKLSETSFSGDVARVAGSSANDNVALIEIQGYVYRAFHGMAEVLEEHGLGRRARRLRQAAERLSGRVHQAFWDPQLEYYAAMVDAQGAKWDLWTSAPGHALWTGVLPSFAWPSVVSRLSSPEFLTGWGIRTVSPNAPDYNPFNAYRGGIRPHESAWIVAGLMEIGAVREAAMIARGLIEAGNALPMGRLPESLVGEARATDQRPLVSPKTGFVQSWSSASPWLILQSLLGLRVDARRRTVHVHAPPTAMKDLEITVTNIHSADGPIGFRVQGGKCETLQLPKGWCLGGEVMSETPQP